MPKYKAVWITDIGLGKFAVRTKAGTKYIARPPNALQEATCKAKELRKGNQPIDIMLYNGKWDTIA